MAAGYRELLVLAMNQECQERGHVPPYLAFTLLAEYTLFSL
jgi:hypothetical protein